MAFTILFMIIMHDSAKLFYEYTLYTANPLCKVV